MSAFVGHRTRRRPHVPYESAPLYRSLARSGGVVVPEEVSKLLILLAWCHIFAHASQVRDVAPDAIIKALHDARFAAGDTQGPGRIGQSFVRDVTPAGSTWDDVNVRAQLARAELVRSDASRDFVTYYCDRGPFTSLLRPSSEVLRGLFQPRDSPNVVVVYLSRGEAAGVLQASMVLAGGCEFIAQDSRAGCSGNLVTLLFECIFSGKPTAAAGSGGADTAAAVVAAAARGACSSSVRKGGPLNLGCKGCIRLVASIVPDSNALAIVAATPCTVTHNTADQAKAHLSLHPLVRAAIIQAASSRATGTGRTISVSSLPEIQTYAAKVLEVDAENSARILAGNEPNVPYPSYPLGVGTISYEDVCRFRASGKYSTVNVSPAPAAPLPRSVPSATMTMCSCAMKILQWRGEAEQPTIACADERCAITLFHRECVGVDADVLGARGGGEDSDDEGDDGIIRTRWRCATCLLADPLQCVCDGKGASPDAESIECTSGASEECAVWHHKVCVGIKSEDVPPEDWTCKRCLEVPK